MTKKSARKQNKQSTKQASTTKRYWFAAREYGYGWYPIRWQGWICLFLAVCSIIFSGLSLSLNPVPQNILYALIQVVITGILLFAISYATGEKPQFRWGSR